MNIIICEDYKEMSEIASEIISKQIKLKPNLTLGLATGSTPIGTYNELIKLYEKGLINFEDVKTFNLDEYYNLPKSNKKSYDFFMKDNLFNYINIKPENTHIPNGTTTDVKQECFQYDKLIEENGGIDLQILGIGSNAHIAFNEPDKSFKNGTYLVDLTKSTIDANSRFFNKKEDVPTKAITMGVGSIFKAKKILLLASGDAKAKAIYDTIHGDIDPQVPSSILQLHDDVTIILDKDSASML